MPLKALVSPSAKDRAESFAARMGMPVSELVDRLFLDLPLEELDAIIRRTAAGEQAELDIPLVKESRLKTAS